MRLPFNGQIPVTQIFGVRKENYQRFTVKFPDGSLHPLEGHNGVDFGMKVGTPIYAPHSGKVIEAAFDANGYGNYVKIENDKEGSTLAHLDSISVKVGYQIAEGDLIGYSGNTGNSTGAHLHWGYFTKPRNRTNGFGGYEDQMKLYLNLFAGLIIKDSLFKPSSYNQVSTGGGNMLPQTKYKVGDEIEIGQDIPVGDAPGKENFNYGKVGAHFPAKVIGIQQKDGVTYYNVDQRYIGGGTGWANAEAIDKAPPLVKAQPQVIVTPSEPIVAPVPQTLPETVAKGDYLIVIEQLGSVSKERDEAINEAKTLKDENLALNGIVAGFKGMGFASPDELGKELQKKNEIILGLQSQIASALTRSSNLAAELSRKDKEDATAIEEAMEVVSQAIQLKDELQKVATSVGTKPKLWDILGAIENIKKAGESAYNKAMREFEEGRKRAETKEKPAQTQSGSVDWLVSLFK